MERKMAKRNMMIGIIAATVGLATAGCMAGSGQSGAAEVSDSAASDANAAIATAIAASTRTPTNLARDRYRNPQETLAFFGVRPGQTVVELWPGGGWYTEILAPLVLDNGGTLYAAGPWERGLNGVRTRQTANGDRYGQIRLAEFPRAATSANAGVPDGSADVVLTFRNVHNWRFGGADNTAAAFRQIFAMLKPGGRLGIEEHRLPESMASSLEETSGYMKVSSVRAFAEAAGFRFVGASEVNANPRDTHDHPDGVWNLPPTLTAGDTNRDRYVAIGESDRMTLLFVKPE
jgi:predicted methyltransferase